MIDVVALGELLIDFAPLSADEGGYPVLAAKPAGAPAEAHEKALAALEARRAAGKAPKINA